MTLDFSRSIGDDYAEYVDDELGYKYHAWEVISASETKRYEHIQSVEPIQLSEMADKLAPLSDLERWALARRLLSNEKRRDYFHHTRVLIDGDLAHPALHYPEIFVDLARRHAEDDDLELARERVEQIAELWPEFQDSIPLLEAQLHLFAGQIEAGHRAFEEALEAFDDDVDLLIETASDFQRARAFDRARQWLQRARTTAEACDDRASLVDIDLMLSSLPDDQRDEPAPPQADESAGDKTAPSDED